MRSGREQPARAAAVLEERRESCWHSPFIHFNLALAYEDLDRIGSALAMYEEAVSLDPEFADAHFKLARLHEIRGNTIRAIRAAMDTRRDLKSFERGKHLFGVHINSIKGKDGQTKGQGPNLWEYVGISFWDSGKTATLSEKNDAGWREYDRIDGSASYRVDVAEPYRGKGFNLANGYSVYDWVGNDGYNNFINWVK